MPVVVLGGGCPEAVWARKTLKRRGLVEQEVEQKGRSR